MKREHVGTYNGNRKEEIATGRGRRREGGRKREGGSARGILRVEGALENQSQRYTVKAVGKRSVGRPHCALCGCTREMTPGSGVCAHGCFWNLIGWVGYSVPGNKVIFTDNRALLLAKMHKWNPVTKRRSAKSFPKIVAAAVALGWSGNTSSLSQPTFQFHR